MRGCTQHALPHAEVSRHVEDFVAWNISEQSRTPSTAVLSRAVEDGSEDLAVLLRRAGADGSLLHALWTRIYDAEAALLGKCHADAARRLVTGAITLDALREAGSAARGGRAGIRKSARATQRDRRALHAPHDLQERRGSYNGQMHTTSDARNKPCGRRRNDETQRRRQTVVFARPPPDAGHR